MKNADQIPLQLFAFPKILDFIPVHCHTHCICYDRKQTTTFIQSLELVQDSSYMYQYTSYTT